MKYSKRLSLVFTFLLVGLCYTAVLASLYFKVFSYFSFIDDEGYALATLRYFSEGHIIFKEFFSNYGPTYYIVQDFLHRLCSIEMTSSGIREIAVISTAVVILICLCMVVEKTKNSVFLILTCCLVYQCALCFGSEPGHPQQVIMLLLSIFALMTFTTRVRRDRWTAYAFCVISGLLFTTKTNIGVFFIVGTTLALLLNSRPGVLQRLGLCCVAIAALILPICLTWPYWPNPEIMILSLSVFISLGILLHQSSYHIRREFFGPKDLLICLGMFFLSLVATCVPALIQGLRVLELVDGLILQHIGFAEAFSSFPPFRSIHLLFLPIISILLYAANHRTKEGKNRILILTKIILALFLFNAAFAGRFSEVWLIGVTFLWVFVQPFNKSSLLAPVFRLDAFALCTACQSLQIYPTAGSQLSISTLLILLLAVICFIDVCPKALLLIPNSTKKAPHIGILISRMTSAALAIGLLYTVVSSRSTYFAGTLLNFEGSGNMRVYESQAKPLIKLVAELRKRDAEFWTFPGMNSLYFWSNKRSPSRFNVTTWMTLLDDNQQLAIANDMRKHKIPLVIYNRMLLKFWTVNNDVSYKPLVKYINNHYASCATFSNYELLCLKQPSGGCRKMNVFSVFESTQKN